MNKGICSCALSVAVLAAGFCGSARAGTAHNSQTGAHTSNAYDTAQMADWKQHLTSRHSEGETLQLQASMAAERSLRQDDSAAKPAVLSADALERIQNEN